MAITKFIQKTRIRLKISLPENTVEGEAISCSVRVVPLSSSETKALESPDIAVKKITTQKSPPVKLSVMVSFPMENRITLMATMINIASEFIA